MQLITLLLKKIKNTIAKAITVTSISKTSFSTGTAESALSLFVQQKGVQPIIGLELHAQLATRTKLFSGAASLGNTAVPCNNLVSAFDLALPGTLPRLNRECVKKCILAALLLKCELADICRFDRKHYFYPDLPLGYQITQKWCPIARGGYLDFYVQDSQHISTNPFYSKRVRIRQLQLEMDSGKTVRNANLDLVDLNRAGVALIEIVTEPDFLSPMEAVCFVEHLRILFAMNGICAGKMNEGHLRVDANISHTVGKEPGRKTELKNIGNIGILESALSKEISRQMEILMEGGEIQEETRALDAGGRTFSARAKGDQMDYRFVSEPNLPPLAIDRQWIKEAEDFLGCQPEPAHQIYIEDFGFPPLFAFETMRDHRLGAFIKKYLAYGQSVPFPHFSMWFAELRFLCDKLAVSFPPIDSQMIRNFAELVHLEHQAKITKLVAIDLLRELTTNSSLEMPPISQLIEERNLWRITVKNEILETVNLVLANKPNLVEKGKKNQQQKGGKDRMLSKLRRLVIEQSRKRISPEDADAAILKSLGRA